MTITPAELATTPVVAGLFATEAGRAHLIGSRCFGCGTLYFPQAISCRNPHCHDKTIEQTALPNRGILYSFTVQRYRPPPLFQMDDWQPYAIGVVDLGQGLHVMGMLTDIALDEIAIGMAMQLTLEPLINDSERGSIITYKFKPETLA